MKNNINKGTHGFPYPLKAVVFDLDGTLMNTLEDIARIANQVLSELGYEEIEANKYRFFLGNGAGALLDSIHKEVDMKESHIDSFDKEYMERYGKSEIGKEAIYPGIMNLLEGLKSKGIKLGVLTNKPHEIAIPLMEKVFPGVFDMVIGQEEGRPRKPDPSGFEIISKELNFQKNQVAYLGDTNTDMLTGKGFGAYTIGVLWGFRDEEELIEAGADITIDKPEDFLKLI